ncbi:MAG: hypothetical protein K8953_03675 [Proteobacteria bacterium]|nr:hypothetical protein [Pseudomonadota bacterium]
MKHNLDKLIEDARKVKPTEQDIFDHKVSFVYGNLKIDDDTITREMVRDAALKYERQKKDKKNEGSQKHC